MDIKAKVKKMRFEPGDHLIVDVDEYLTKEMVIRIKAQIKNILKKEIEEKGIKIIILDKNVKMRKRKNQMEKGKNDEFEFWAVIELFGHQKIAGRLIEKPKGSVIFFQIDVPDGAGQIRYSRIINASSIYVINPTDKETILRICAQEPFDTNRPAIPYIPKPHEPRVQASGMLWEQEADDEEM